MSYSRRSPTPTGRLTPESSAANSKRTDENSTWPLTSRRRTYYCDRFVGRKERGEDVLRLLGCRRPREVCQMEERQSTRVRDQPQVNEKTRKTKYFGAGVCMRLCSINDIIYSDRIMAGLVEGEMGVRGRFLLQVQEQEKVLGGILVEAGQRQARVGLLRRSKR